MKTFKVGKPFRKDEELELDLEYKSLRKTIADLRVENLMLEDNHHLRNHTKNIDIFFIFTILVVSFLLYIFL